MSTLIIQTRGGKSFFLIITIIHLLRLCGLFINVNYFIGGDCHQDSQKDNTVPEPHSLNNQTC